MTAADVNDTVMRLIERQQVRQADLERYPDIVHEDDAVVDSPTPIFDLFLSHGPDTILLMTNFTTAEFNSIWYNLQDHDVLFMVLTVLKHGGTWDYMGRRFGLKGPTFQRLVIRYLAIIDPMLYETYVVKAANKFTMKKLVTSGHIFKHYKTARYATDVTFQQSYRPSGKHEEVKPYYSKKHGLYGYKVETSVLPNGLSIGCTEHFRGATHDVQIFRQNADFHLRELQKQPVDSNVPDRGPLADKFPDQWCVLADKAYQGLQEHFRVIHPKKAKPNQDLSMEEERENRDISSDRIIVENYFGRLCNLWRVCSDKFRWDEGLYDTIFRVCLSLTNANIMIHPLRDDDEGFYNRRMNKLAKIGDEIQRKRKLSQSTYRAKRRMRLEAGYLELGGEE
ncbi:hypothetical protein H310_04424 [Aphanomyces invadans]|uniref:DDE Tnp4 domain-containing protein n=1 Tax=Aphanomyces invadans TaxID=157072 RepID=A0A024UEJ2_9STRA|nr:hypothetical protein H310_04424 [Aphanomyces invadans]ETW04038.1 hypothetical protein H310_04424 [Aphanomyces invadans]|eukprot:XP_008866994.1 hypothetical protein H310_04424 [Aphanomyces invadans]